MPRSLRRPLKTHKSQIIFGLVSLLAASLAFRLRAKRKGRAIHYKSAPRTIQPLACFPFLSLADLPTVAARRWAHPPKQFEGETAVWNKNIFPTICIWPIGKLFLSNQLPAPYQEFLNQRPCMLNFFVSFDSNMFPFAKTEIMYETYLIICWVKLISIK